MSDGFDGPNCGFKSVYWGFNRRRWKVGYHKDTTTSALTHNVWVNIWFGPIVLTLRKVTLRDEQI
jgi:hypothetical protein